MESALIGFDVRELSVEPEALWPLERRTVFLLRDDVVRPLSTDPTVWPSLFATGHGRFLPGTERERLHLTGLPPPAWTGANAGLWEDLARMRRSTYPVGSARRNPL